MTTILRNVRVLATDQRTDDQGDHHVHAGQAEDQHDADRSNHCIHFTTSKTLRWISHRQTG